MASCILHQNSDATITLIDIPRSIELAQGDTSGRLISSKAIEKPFPSLEPKTEKAKAHLGEPSLEEQLLCKHIQLSLDQLKMEWKGEWCLPRRVSCEGLENEAEAIPGVKRRRRTSDDHHLETSTSSKVPDATETGAQSLNFDWEENGSFFIKSSMEHRIGTVGEDQNLVCIPANSTVLSGDIASTRYIFTFQKPFFDLIILDPPWPNRSARRKKSYEISYGNGEMKKMLSSIPIETHLTEDGFVGVWVTNKSAFREMVLGEKGLFKDWGVNFMEEWIWLKVTSSGEPITALHSMWRKPYEVLLLGKRGVSLDSEVTRRVIVGAPDLHSRKPNLKTLFEQFMKKDEYEALEIFARNLTAGWWAWGNEVLKFQSSEYWIEAEH